MAIIKELPGTKIISGFKGTLDFYYYMGIPVCRSWPKSPGSNRAPAVRAGWSAWTYASKMWNDLDQTIRDAYNWTAEGSSLTGRDLQMKAYISDYFRDGQWA